MPKPKVYDDEPIQWHLASSGRDVCPRCGGEIGYIKQNERMCLGECGEQGVGWILPMSIAEFLRLKDRGERLNYVVQEGVQQECVSPGAKLLRAAALVEDVCATLDTGRTDPCGACGLKKSSNWDEHQIHNRLSAIAGKLRRNAERLAGEEVEA